MILWRVLDKYGGRYDSRGYTRNIVDVQIMIPSLNLHALEHFCYRYMSRRTGEPQVVVPRLLRQGLARLYNRFFVFEGEVFKPLQISFRCTPSKCHHKDEDAVPDPAEKHDSALVLQQSVPGRHQCGNGECYVISIQLIKCRDLFKLMSPYSTWISDALRT